MPAFVTRSLRCPVCDVAFARDVPEPGRLAARDTDFRPRFEGTDPLAFAVEACPNCRFAAHRQDFASHGSEQDEHEDPAVESALPANLAVSVDADVIEDLRRWVKRGEHTSGFDFSDREPTAAERYVVAARCLEFVREKDNRAVAELWLRASWCARAEGDRRLEGACQGEAVARLAACLQELSLAPADRARLAYLLAELSRRIGDFGRAVDMFGRVPDSADPDDPEGRILLALAKRQVALAMVKSSVNATIPRVHRNSGPEGEEPG